MTPRRNYSFKLSLLAFVLAGFVFADEPEELLTANDLSDEDRSRITAVATDELKPLQVGERLVYKVGWGFIEAGQAILALTEDEFEGQPALKVELVASTNTFADNFYKVRNRSTAWFLPDMSQSLGYKSEQREGKRERDTLIRLKPKTNTATYENLRSGGEREPIAVTESIWDPMSITYYVRSLPLVIGEQLVIPTTNGKELFLTEVDIVKEKRRKFKIGRRDALILEPNIKDLGGVFSKSKNASIRFYISDDEHQYPLRMESAVVVGKFWAELVRIEKIPATDPL